MVSYSDGFLPQEGTLVTPGADLKGPPFSLHAGCTWAAPQLPVFSSLIGDMGVKVPPHQLIVKMKFSRSEGSWNISIPQIPVLFLKNFPVVSAVLLIVFHRVNLLLFDCPPGLRGK